jgi:hypothetical protein
VRAVYHHLPPVDLWVGFLHHHLVVEEVEVEVEEVEVGSEGK